MDNKVLYGILTILFNSYGVPAFMQGYTKAGILQIVSSFVQRTNFTAKQLHLLERANFIYLIFARKSDNRHAFPLFSGRNFKKFCNSNRNVFN